MDGMGNRPLSLHQRGRLQPVPANHRNLQLVVPRNPSHRLDWRLDLLTLVGMANLPEGTVIVLRLSLIHI